MTRTQTFTIDLDDVQAIRDMAATLMDYADAADRLAEAIGYRCDNAGCDFVSSSPQGIAAHGRMHKPAKRRRKARRSHHEWSDAELAWIRDHDHLSNGELVAEFRKAYPDFEGSDGAIESQRYSLRSKTAA